MLSFCVCLLFDIGTVLKQPLAKIREYFGEDVALYFSFLNFLSLSFLVPSLLGLLLAVYE